MAKKVQKKPVEQSFPERIKALGLTSGPGYELRDRILLALALGYTEQEIKKHLSVWS